VAGIIVGGFRRSFRINMSDPIASLTRREWWVWICSLVVIVMANILPGDFDLLTLIASCIGVTSLVLAAMGEMLGNIAHQWRQPLSVISTAATGIKLQKDLNILNDKDLDYAMSSINNSAQYLSKTIDDFRSFFDPKNNKEKEFSLLEMIEKSLSIVSSQFVSKNIEIIKNIEDIKILSSENELIQVILNILNNAKDALNKIENSKKLIFISIYLKNEEIFIEIKDNAGGVDNDIVEKIFDPYFTTKHQSQGTGIGLYMSQNIIKNILNGHLKVSNDTFIYEGVEYIGAKFTISLKYEIKKEL
jgi:signal transduction histidine kinase